jgi:hypothetical protein
LDRLLSALCEILDLRKQKLVLPAQRLDFILIFRKDKAGNVKNNIPKITPVWIFSDRLQQLWQQVRKVKFLQSLQQDLDISLLDKNY